MKTKKRAELRIVNIILEIKNPQQFKGTLPKIEVKKVKSNSGRFLKQLFIYNSIKVSSLSLLFLKKKN